MDNYVFLQCFFYDFVLMMVVRPRMELAKMWRSSTNMSPETALCWVTPGSCAPSFVSCMAWSRMNNMGDSTEPGLRPLLKKG